jgi:prepilin-type N-terminal cleavage/methylation domain-containing protein
MHSKLSKQSGFTLVEIAIVLVIIGLLLGGVLKGQEMITSSKVKSLAGGADGIVAAFNTYQDRYRALPGDDANVALPVARFSLQDCGGVAVCGVATGGTLGNGQIEGGWNTVTAGATAGLVGSTIESRMFWQQLRAAKLIGTDGSVDPSIQPKHPMGGYYGVQYVATNGLPNGNNLHMTAIMGKEAALLDTMLDDGVMNQGSVRGANYAALAAPYVDGTAYTVVKPLK